MSSPRARRVRRLEGAFGRGRGCAAHRVEIVLRRVGDAAAAPPACARCGRPADAVVVELRTVPDRRRPG